MISVEAIYDKSDYGYLYGWKNKINKSIKYSYGVIYQKKVITCFHGTKFSNEIKINDNVTDIINYSPEVDISILKCPKKLKNNSVEPIHSLSLIEKNIGIINVEGKKMELLVRDIVFKKVHGPSSPLLPYISCIFKDKTIPSKIDLHGLSGCPVFVNGLLIGIIDCLLDDRLIVIPMIIIDRILEKINSFPVLPMYGKIVSCKNDKGNDVNGVYVCEHSPLDFRYKKKSKLILNNDDILISLNGTSLNDHGYIYSKKLDYYIPLESYIALFCNTNKKMILEIYKKKIDKKGTSIYELTKLNLHPIESEVVNKIPIYITDKKYIIYKGLVLCELDEFLLNTMKCESSDAIIWHRTKNYYNTNKKQRIVVIIDVIEKNIDKDYLEIYRKVQLGKVLAIVSRIGKTNVINLDTINDNINTGNPSLTIRTELDKLFTISYVARKHRRLKVINKPI